MKSFYLRRNGVIWALAERGGVRSHTTRTNGEERVALWTYTGCVFVSLIKLTLLLAFWVWMCVYGESWFIDTLQMLKNSVDDRSFSASAFFGVCWLVMCGSVHYMARSTIHYVFNIDDILSVVKSTKFGIGYTNWKRKMSESQVVGK